MRSIGIICECNPYHAGHEYLFLQARASGADVVVAVMSGCFTQRGEAAVADPWLRAEALLSGGADLVLELPYPYAAASAEFFAGGGVEVLDRLGVSELWFGSECGDLSRLLAAAEVCERADFRARYAETVQESCGTAEAFFEVLQSFCREEQRFSSNDILGIAYLRAIRARKSKLCPVTVKREGSAYLDKLLPTEGYPSATALRQVWREQGLSAVLPRLPESVRAVYARVAAPCDLQYAERLILGQLRLAPPHAFDAVAELSGGLGARLSALALSCTSLEELLQRGVTKKYPLSRLRRGLLFSLTGVTPDDLRRAPAYVRLLAANDAGRAFLSACRRTAALPVITRLSELPQSREAEAQRALSERAWSLYRLTSPTPLPADDLWKRGPVLKNL